MVLEQNKICSNIPRSDQNSSLIPLLVEKRATLSDMECDSQTIGLLLGANILGSLFTAKVCQLKNGLSAVETFLGWTVMGNCLDSNIICLINSKVVSTLSLNVSDL